MRKGKKNLNNLWVAIISKQELQKLQKYTQIKLAAKSVDLTESGNNCQQEYIKIVM
jgi:hypothetical protein